MTWPTGDRDTTEFPKLNVTVDAEFRQHLADILKIPNGTLSNDYETIKLHSFQGKSDQRIRTYRKLYERLGLVYVRNNKIEHSKLSVNLSNLEKNLKVNVDNKLQEISNSIVKILARYQFINPIDSTASETNLPKVHPYFLIWKIMRALDNKLHYQEVNRVVLRLETDEEVDAAITKIRNARIKLNSTYQDNAVLDSELGLPVITDQPSARISSLFSIAGWGGLLIEIDADSEGFRNLCKHALIPIDNILINSPTFFETDSSDEWFKYYFSENEINEQDQLLDNYNITPNTITTAEICSRIANLNGHFEQSVVEELHFGLTFHPSKHFVLLRGASGTGKTLLVRSYVRAIFDIKNIEEPAPLLFLCPVRPNWTDPSQILGYYDVISNKYIVPLTLKAILTAHENPNAPVFLCFDEMNLARIEHYLSDVLSAMESTEEFELHSRGNAVSSPEGKIIPEKITLPSNLYIIGTINVDESTVAISDKVLDRAVIINLKQSDLSNYLDFLSTKISYANETIQQLKPFLCALSAILAKGDLALTNRTTEEIILYLNRVRTAANSNFEAQIDKVIKSKVIEKLKGNEGSREILEDLKALFEGDSFSEKLSTSSLFITELQTQLDEFGAFKAFR